MGELSHHREESVELNKLRADPPPLFNSTFSGIELTESIINRWHDSVSLFYPGNDASGRSRYSEVWVIPHSILCIVGYYFPTHRSEINTTWMNRQFSDVRNNWTLLYSIILILNILDSHISMIFLLQSKITELFVASLARMLTTLNLCDWQPLQNGSL